MKLSPISSSPIYLLLLFISFCIPLIHFESWRSPSRQPSQTLTLNSSPLDSIPCQNLTEESQDLFINYIVRFLEYKRAEEHLLYLELHLPFSGWKWIQRRNLASKFPTDFGLVSIQGSVREKLINELQRLELVKDVNVDGVYKRGLLKDERRRVGAFLDGKKRPGKLFTSMSFTEENGEYYTSINNSSISWERQLLSQVKSG